MKAFFMCNFPNVSEYIYNTVLKTKCVQLCFSSIFELTLDQFLENQICNTGPNFSSAVSTYIIVYSNTCTES